MQIKNCPSCKKNLGITFNDEQLYDYNTDKETTIEGPIHETNSKHYILVDKELISLENFLRIVNEEEIPTEESGYRELILEEEHEHSTIPCFLCGKTDKYSACCSICRVVVCSNCYDTHDRLIISVQQEKKKNLSKTLNYKEFLEMN